MEPPLTDANGLAYHTVLNYRVRHDEQASARDITDTYVADGNSAQIFQSTYDSGDTFYYAAFSGLLMAPCDKPMPPFNIIDALERFDTSTVGETLTLQASASDPLYDYVVKGSGQADFGGVKRAVSNVVRTYEDTDDTGEIHTYEEQLWVLTAEKIRVRQVDPKDGERWLVSMTPPETAFEQEMQDMVDDSDLGTCVGLL